MKPFQHTNNNITFCFINCFSEETCFIENKKFQLYQTNTAQLVQTDVKANKNAFFSLDLPLRK